MLTALDLWIARSLVRRHFAITLWYLEVEAATVQYTGIMKGLWKPTLKVDRGRGVAPELRRAHGQVGPGQEWEPQVAHGVAGQAARRSCH